MKRFVRQAPGVLAGMTVIALAAAAAWGVTCFSDPANPPTCTASAGDKVCSGDTSRQCFANTDCVTPQTCVSAGATTIGVRAVPFSGMQITSASISGSANLATIPSSVSGGINATVTFRVKQTTTTQDDAGTVVVHQSNGATCSVDVGFDYQAASGSTPQTICSLTGGYTFDVINVLPSPSGTTACSSHLANCTESPGLPAGYDYLSNDSRVLSVHSPITSAYVDMQLTRAGGFLSDLRLMFSHFNGSSFPVYQDITYYVQPGSTRIRGTGQWSDIKVVAGTSPPGSGFLTPAIGEWGMMIMSLLLMSASSVLLARRRVAMSLAGPSGALAPPLFDAGLFRPIFVGVGTLGLLSSFIAVGLGWTPSATDVVGSLLSAGILAYLLHFWIALARRHGKGGPR